MRDLEMKTDIEMLRGVWRVVSLEIDGGTISGAALDGATITIQGDRFTSIGMGAQYGGTIEVDATHNPNTFNMNFKTGPENGNVNLGIYELNGDSWRICLATKGTTRPREFVATPGTGIALEVLKRN
jgi:uncharacterized protein (TIGR03067 family)